MPCTDFENTPLPGDTENVLLRKLLNRLCNVTSGGGGGVSQAYVDARDAATLAAALASASGLYVLKSGDTMTGSLNMTSGQAFNYNSVPIARGITALRDYFFGGAGNLTMTGADNIAIGNVALSLNTSGSQLVAIGGDALKNNTTGTDNTAFGFQTLKANTTGVSNTAFGNSAMVNSLSGGSNVAIGVNALNTATAASNTVAIGVSALQLATGSNNIGIGFSAGNNITTGAKNIIIGHDIDAPVATNSNQINIGNIIFATGASGTGTTIAGAVGIGTTAPTAPLTVKSDVGGPNIDIIGRSVGANEGYIQFFKGDGTTLEGFIYGETGKLKLGDALAADVLTITAGNVGIGITAPLAKLHVKPAASGTDYFRIDHSDGTPRFQVGALTGALTNGAMWFGNITPDATNYGLANDGGTTFLNADTGGAINFSLAGASVFNMSSAGHLLWTPDNTYDIGAAGATRPRNYFGAGTVNAAGGLITGNVAALVTSSAAMNNGAAAALGTLTDAPIAGNPTKWIPIDDNGTTRYIPAW